MKSGLIIAVIILSTLFFSIALMLLGVFIEQRIKSSSDKKKEEAGHEIIKIIIGIVLFSASMLMLFVMINKLF